MQDEDDWFVRAVRSTCVLQMVGSGGRDELNIPFCSNLEGSLCVRDG